MKVWAVLIVLFLTACNLQSQGKERHDSGPVKNCETGGSSGIAWHLLKDKNCNRLSDYRLFQDANNPLENPSGPGIAYQLATELFSDYAHKHRFLYVPEGSVEYDGVDVFQLPVGSVIAKTFVLPVSNKSEYARDIVETRLLIHRENGWIGLPYVWNENRTDAFLVVTGERIAKYISIDGVGVGFEYEIPTAADCKTCHISRTSDSSKIVPIGLKARHLNIEVSYEGRKLNQLFLWEGAGLLSGLPYARSEIAGIPVWEDETRSLEDRAKGYLDINCSHCHTPGGSGSESGMFLEYWRDALYFDHGICKRPGGYNGGQKGLVFDIVPGNADQSLIPYRMGLLASEGEGKGQMPPIARHLNHKEGIRLISDWINSMPARDCL